MSTEVTTEMMNEVIARFMGGTRIQHPEQKFFSEDHFGYVCHKGHWWNERNLQYHTSWDWLMPVLDKIGKDRPTFIASQSDTEYHCNIGIGFIRVIGKTRIEAVHKAVYQFITWYNQQKQTNGQ